MRVLKFGGTSVGSAEGLLQAKNVIESCSDDIIVVVSALGGITDQLIRTSKTAAAGDPAYEKQLEAIYERHFRQAEDTVIPEMLPEVKAKCQLWRTSVVRHRERNDKQLRPVRCTRIHQDTAIFQQAYSGFRRD